MTLPAPTLPGLTGWNVLAVPERLVDSAWLGHVPFAFWLMEAHRPARVVELGVHNGASFCAMIQGAKAIGLDCRLAGVDHWLGDGHAGEYGADVYWDLMAHHETRHRDVSTLMACRFEDALGHFADGSVDLLHIDGFHTYEAVRNDFETWLPKMSARGVVIFHDTAERQEGFGVWRLWAEVSADRPSFDFSHSHGLGVLYVGSDPVPEWMAALDAAQDGPQGDGIRAYFNGLGDGIVARRDAARANERADRLQAEADAQRRRADLLQDRIDVGARALGSANVVAAAHAGRIAALQTQVTETDARANRLSADLDAAHAELDAERMAHEATRTANAVIDAQPFDYRVGTDGGTVRAA